MELIDLAVLQPPENILRGVSRIGKIEGVEIGVTGTPDATVITLGVAINRIGIAVENEVDLADLPGGFQNLLEMVEPAYARPHGNGGGVGVGRKGRCGPSEDPSGKSICGYGESDEGGEKKTLHPVVFNPDRRDGQGVFIFGEIYFERLHILRLWSRVRYWMAAF